MHVRPIPKVSTFMAVTTKKVTEKAQKWAKMARFWPKTRHNGRVMARKIFFHQCLWVTKFCAKFGHSRIPRTASAHKSFIILRCMWKEPAPLVNVHYLVEWCGYELTWYCSASFGCLDYLCSWRHSYPGYLGPEARAHAEAHLQADAPLLQLAWNGEIVHL